MSNKVADATPKRVLTDIEKEALKEKRKRKAKQIAISTVRTLILLCIGFLIIYPLLIKFSASFKSISDLYNPTVNMIPKKPTLDRYAAAMRLTYYLPALRGTFILSMVVGLMNVAVSTLVGYGIARFKFPGKSIIIGMVILVLVMPPQTYMSSIYLMFLSFDPFGLMTLIKGGPISLVNSYLPISFIQLGGMGIKSGLYIYLMRQFFRGMPNELDEAARIDGAGVFKIFYSIMLPNAIPMITTVFLFSFSWQWTDSYYSSMFLSGTKLLAGTLHLAAGEWPPILGAATANAALVLCLAPLFIVYLFGQKFFIQGVENTGLVG